MDLCGVKTYYILIYCITFQPILRLQLRSIRKSTKTTLNFPFRPFYISKCVFYAILCLEIFVLVLIKQQLFLFRQNFRFIRCFVCFLLRRCLFCSIRCPASNGSLGGSLLGLLSVRVRRLDEGQSGARVDGHLGPAGRAA